ncbi:valine--pyruvate transaminase [Marinobacteraceae bacterium S3BR75-40.1]
MQLSKFGRKFATDAGITALMDDLGNALASGEDIIMMGGGNPGHLPEVESVFRERLQAIVDDEASFRRLIGVYDPPQGEKQFINSLVELLNRTYGWELNEKNIALTNGSQAAFFMLFNMLAGEQEDGSFRQILLPLAPEYIGYSDAGLSPGLFRSVKPDIEYLEPHVFKYHVDFDHLDIDEQVAALCVSRPTNPTANVLTDAEMAGLEERARSAGIPFIVDGAYGLPFPSLMYTEATPRWNDNIILCLSLSKLGLPAARTGIVIASEPYIEALSSINAILNLATGSFGAMLAEPLVRSGELLTLSRDVVCPAYRRKMERSVEVLREAFGDECPWYVHKPEGAMFLWLWFPELPISSRELYQRLKQRGVLVVSGDYFFPGLEEDDWAHRNECIRVTYAQDQDRVDQGLRVIAEEVIAAYREEAAI